MIELVSKMDEVLIALNSIEHLLVGAPDPKTLISKGSMDDLKKRLNQLEIQKN